MNTTRTTPLVGHEPGSATHTIDLRDGTPQRVEPGQRVTVQGATWANVLAVTRLGDTTRVTYRTRSGPRFTTKASADVEVLTDAARGGLGGDVMAYWQTLARSLPTSDPTRRAMERTSFVNPHSALARYLRGDPVEPIDDPPPAIYPFPSNISQRTAVDTALTYPISVIEGPPGTGKTQTILNIVASVVAAGDQTVAIVSSTNSAVDNVREKLDAIGIGIVAAPLGNKENRAAFLAGQPARNAALDAALNRPAPETTVSNRAMQRLSKKLHEAQEWEREQARIRSTLRAYTLEHEHFQRLRQEHGVPALERLPLLRKSSRRILGYLAESSLEDAEPGLLTRVRRYFSYGNTASLDPNDIGSVLGLQEAYYRRRIAELEHELGEVDRKLSRVDLDALIREHADASRLVLDQAIQERYRRLKRRTYEDGAWARGRGFSRDYPVILSTCHSLARCLPEGGLVDLLVIDESSQVSLLVAAAALTCARRVVVVGDTRQLPHIPGRVPEDVEAPHPAFDHRTQNLLSSVHERFGPQLPGTMLVEHYRCAPAIIEFCNRSFYGGRLISLTDKAADEACMSVTTTTEGSHMRSPRGGGATNQREVDIIRDEIIPRLGLTGRQVGYIAPYRAQATKLGEFAEGPPMEPGDVVDVSVPAGPPRSQADTVHKFQGRQCDVVVFSSVIDDSWRGRYQRGFVDDARLINVAVSRAANQFVLVTHHSRHPKSRYLADLIGYIEYQDPTQVRRSAVVSVFDLLYRDYAPVLEQFAQRVERRSKYPSEDIGHRVIADVLEAEENAERFGGLSIVPQYRLIHLFGTPDIFDAEQLRFIRTTASVDFVVERPVSRKPLLAIEVDGWKYHENNPEQQARDRLKDSIFERAGMPLLRLETTGSNEHERITRALHAALDGYCGPTPDDATPSSSRV